MKKYIIGIDLGATCVKVGLVNAKNKILLKKKFATKIYCSKLKLIEAIIRAVEDLMREKKLDKKDILGIGMGLPGPIDSKEGIVQFFPNIPGWYRVPLKKIIQNRFNIPTFIDNDVNLMALAESKIGSGKNAKNIICLTLGTGVGGGIILEGRLYRGWKLSAGEIGHVPLNENGPVCNCG
jgi:glucokinase